MNRGMKSSTIKIILNKKLKNLFESVDDAVVRKRMEADTIVAGGAIASMLAGEEINDYDIYFRTFETTKAVAEYYVKKFNESEGELKKKYNGASCNPSVTTKEITNIKGVTEERIIIYMKSSGVATEGQSEYAYFEMGPEEHADVFVSSITETLHGNTENCSDTAEAVAADLRSKKSRYRPIFFSDNAITLSDKVQLVIRFYGEPTQILNNYDYAHSMCYFDYRNQVLQLHQDALECILSKNLVYKGSLYPIASIFRTRKFIERGWRISAGQMLKIIWQIKEIDLDNRDILREQLIGVDQAYMTQLIEELNKEEGRVDSAYISKLIDEIF